MYLTKHTALRAQTKETKLDLMSLCVCMCAYIDRVQNHLLYEYMRIVSPFSGFSASI